MGLESNLIYTCFTKKNRTGENLVPDHTLTMVLAGTSHAYSNGRETITEAGGFRFMPKNSLAKFAKYPDPQEGYKVLSIVLDRQSLLEYYRKVNPPMSNSRALTGITTLKSTTILRSFFASLTPYIDDEKGRFRQISKNKITEAISILLDYNPAFAGVLFDFGDKGKIDLQEFMSKNFRYNISIPDFARLTARSISSFKRDFNRIFGTTPFDWLKQKRLEEAFFLLREKRIPPSEAAFLSGFVNYSHFYRLFKEKYKASPSHFFESANRL